jgi:ankyrin repeat protein
MMMTDVQHLSSLPKTIYIEMVSLLLDYGADIDHQTKSGATALFVAAKQNNIDLVHFVKITLLLGSLDSVFRLRVYCYLGTT